MVHKKYIKRDGKVFGPYLYQNYRENGVTKTRYLGVAKKRKKVQVNLFWIAGIFIFIALFLFFGIFLLNFAAEKGSDFAGELASKSPFDFLTKLFITSSPVNVFVRIMTDNTPPEFFTRPSEILVCENKMVSEVLLVKDSLGDNLDFSFYPDLRIRLRFSPEGIIASGDLDEVILWTRELNFNDINRRRNLNEGWAVYPESIIVGDGFFSDSFNTNLVIIEVNDAPEFDMGVQTIDVYLKGEGTNFYYDLGSELILNGEETPKQNLIYNLTYQNGSISPFNISNLGVINISGNESYILDGNFTNYPLMVCVNDTSLLALGRILHENISLCWNYGLNQEAKKYCDNFTLTITKENRQPKITSYNPLNISFHEGTNESFNRTLIVGGTDILYFNLTAYDPDWTPLDVYWYVDNASKEYYEGLGKNNASEFEYFFGCGISGNHLVKAVVTDGLLNDSIQWNISVEYVSCSSPVSGGSGGGGGSGKLYCKEKWGCDEWMQCKNLYESIEKKWVTKDIELLIKERCDVLNYTKEFCGFQNRICKDFNYCKTEFDKPPFIRECYYTENPNCTDGIKNCHNGRCEDLVDCGGPCPACPTCNDGIKNQNETGIDCGGPCPRECIELPWLPIVFKSIITYSLIALLIIVLLLVARQIMKYTKFKKIFGESRIKNILIRSGGKRDEDKQVRNVIANLFFIFFVIVLLFFANTYILNLGQANKIISSTSDIGAGFLASYGLINNIFNNLGMFFVYGPIINENSRLTLSDDTDSQVKRSGWEVYFYADYEDLAGNPITNSDGNCNIRFQDSEGIYGSWYLMEYDSVSGLWKNMSLFNYKGTYKFEISCLYGGYTNGGEDNFTITNSIPEISREQGSDWINFDGYAQNHDIWQCNEDVICYYDLSANVTDLDINDILIYSYNTGNTTLTDYNLIEDTGVLEINITKSSYTGLKRIELKVRDNEPDALWHSALLEVNISPVNDAPEFVNLKNQVFNEGDLFQYTINVEDEENNFPFKFDVSFVSCSNFGTRGNCTLFNYAPDEINGRVFISFTPVNKDIGSYVINFSVMDNSSLGNKTTSQLVNFTVTPALWNGSLVLDYILTEDENKFINLTKEILETYREDVNFSYNLINSEFPTLDSSFNLVTGIINITPVDADVGYNGVEIIATSQGISSFRIFNFSVLNINDSVFIDGFTVNEKVNITGLRLRTYENTQKAGLYLYLRDDDFAISQKNFYNESLTINLTIEGPNPDLFEFVDSGMDSENIVKYSAEFDTLAGDIGEYNVSVSIFDANNFSSAVLRFNLTVMNRSYDAPDILYPDEFLEFNMKENVTSNLTFQANHTVGDDLFYEFYIDNFLRDSFLGNGNGSNVSWLFAPNFTDETYEDEIKNLTLIVRNPYYSDLYATRSWNLTISHTNSAPMLIKEIQDKGPVTYPYEFGIDLIDYFYDADYYDAHYNNTPEGILKFDVISNVTDSKITKRYAENNWVYIGAFAATVEQLNINTSDNQSFVLSNNFTVTFVPPETISIPTPSSGGGGGGGGVPIALKIIVPGQISAYEGETIKIPLKLINSGSKDFNDVTLNSSAYKNSSLFNEIKTSLDKTYLKVLKPKQEENLTLTVFFNKSKLGNYEVLINVTSKNPKYTDWGKIHINLQAINESQVRELIIFTEELIASNPECIEITEIIEEANKYYLSGNYIDAQIKTNEALNSCREAISHPSMPRVKIFDFIKYLNLSSYLFLAIIGSVALAIILGLIYYFIKRKQIAKLQKSVQELKEGDTKV